jgi:peptide/nickel transport system ATP-binding protein
MIELINVNKSFKKRGVFGLGKDTLKAVDDVSFAVEKGRTFGLVGESGSGKTTIAKMVVGILAPDSGEVKIAGDRDIVFQDPFSSLNPRMKVRDIVGEPLLVRGVNRIDRQKLVKDVLSMVRLDAGSSLEKYPHQFSGGERQRIAIARALVHRPAAVVLDEPVSSLDVLIQARILNLLKDLKEELGLTYLFISHDLRVVEFMADTVGVLKDGKLVEVADKSVIYRDPRAEYTRTLLDSIPGL